MRTLSRRELLRAALGAGVAAAGSSALLPFEAGTVRASGRKAMIFAWLVPHDAASVASFQQHADVITHVSPTWYSMDKNRAIIGQVDPTIVQFARAHGVSLVPLIKNKDFSPAVAHDILANAARRTEAANNIADLVTGNSFDGINIDFEGPFGESRQRYSAFLMELAGLLRPKGKLLTADVVPQLKPVTEHSSTSWAAAYDYPAIARACDAVMLMCYAYSGASPGSLSPRWWLEQATGYALPQIPAPKLIVGMSFYGREWTIKSGTTTHRDLTESQALALLASSGATLKRPAHDDTPRFTWTDTSGEHIVHFENEKSLSDKLKFVHTAGVAGATFWRLGQEQPSQWKAIKRTLG